MPAIGCLVDLVLDWADVETLAIFWADVLGRQIRDHQDGWISLSHGEDGHRLSFQQVSEYQPPQWPGQMVPQHAQVRALGATPADGHPGPRPPSVVHLLRPCWAPVLLGHHRAVT